MLLDAILVGKVSTHRRAGETTVTILKTAAEAGDSWRKNYPARENTRSGEQ